jgi:hypothetical protein
MPIRVLAALGAVAALAAGCGGSSKKATKEPANVFLERVLRQELAGRYDDAWETMSPAQQRLVPKDLFVRCQAGSPRAAVVRVKTLEVRKEPHSTAVRLGVIIEIGGQQTPVIHTFHAVKIDGEWRWLLDQSQVDALAKGRCPGG